MNKAQKTNEQDAEISKRITEQANDLMASVRASRELGLEVNIVTTHNPVQGFRITVERPLKSRGGHRYVTETDIKPFQSKGITIDYEIGVHNVLCTDQGKGMPKLEVSF